MDVVSDNQWTQIVLDNIYTIWFWCLGLKSTSSFQNYFPMITRRALFLLSDLMSEVIVV